MHFVCTVTAIVSAETADAAAKLKPGCIVASSKKDKNTKKRQPLAEAVAATTAQSPSESPEGASTDPRLTRAYDLVVSDDDTPPGAPVASTSGEPAQATPLKKPRLDLERGVAQG
jgi:hypothetical protein